MTNMNAYIGLNYGGKEWSREYAARTICKCLNDNKISACTILPCFGLWQGEAENSLCVTLINVNEEDAAAALQSVAHELAQWEILYTCGNRSVTIRNDASAARAELAQA